MIDAIIGASATIAVGLVALVQWLVSERNARRDRLVDQQVQARERDTDLTNWGMQVISLMAELEAACDPFGESVELEQSATERLAFRASALVDQGRLFFPNVDVAGTPGGIRVALLDEVLRTFYCARHLAATGRKDGPLLKAHVWHSRKRFVNRLQSQIRLTLRNVVADDAGDSIPKSPLVWSLPVAG
jgi:hypothetical protein